MKKLIVLLLFVPLVFSCSSDDDGDMQLTIVNNHPNWEKITEVKLQDYDFDEVQIAVGSSRTFTLYNGISSGISDIRLIYNGCLRKDRNAVLTADFEDGKNTTITINPSGTLCEYTPTIVIN
tara:strand:+ start:665 stop:1030 length:366 start_codon:yes stop_codon:yes gene_type:complete